MTPESVTHAKKHHSTAMTVSGSRSMAAEASETRERVRAASPATSERAGALFGR